MHERTVALIGEDNFRKLQDSRVLIVGLGGVGGYVLESLVRCGVGTIGLCDFDIADDSNLNRQILVTKAGIGEKKTQLAKERALSINPEVNLVVYDFRINPENLSELELESWDFIADCIDDTKAKVALMKACEGKIISCMGTGNKLDPFSFEITQIEKTQGDPLARSIRKNLRQEGVGNVSVLYSKESPVRELNGPIPTISYMPGVAGLEISSYIIKKLLN